MHGSRNVYKQLNAGDFNGAANAIMKISSGKEMRKGKEVAVRYGGLVKRRAEEAGVFRNAPNAPLRSAAK